MGEKYLKLEGKWLQTKSENVEKVFEAQGKLISLNLKFIKIIFIATLEGRKKLSSNVSIRSLESLVRFKII